MTEPNEKRGPGRRLVLLLALLLTGAAVFGVVRWRERDLRAAQKALAAGEAEEAYQLVTRFLSERPGHVTAKALLARTFVALGKPESAIEMFDDVGAATSEELHSLGRAYLMGERWSEALPVLMQSVQLDPTNPDALYELTSTRLQLGMSEDALESAMMFASTPGNEARGWVVVGSIYGDLGNYEQAADAYLRVLEFSPDAKDLEVVRADELHLELGRMLLGSGKPEEAIPYIEKSIDALPSDDAYVSMGVARAELGELKLAVEAWTRAVSISPSNLDAREYLANERLQESDAEAALKWLKPLEASASLKASTAYALQRCYTLLEEADAAEKWRERTEALRAKEKLAAAIESMLADDPNSYWSHVIRAHQFASAGNWEQAKLVLEAVVSEAENPFVADLVAAVRDRTALPSLDRLPISQF